MLINCGRIQRTLYLGRYKSPQRRLLLIVNQSIGQTKLQPVGCTIGSYSIGLTGQVVTQITSGIIQIALLALPIGLRSFTINIQTRLGLLHGSSTGSTPLWLMRTSNLLRRITQQLRGQLRSGRHGQFNLNKTLTAIIFPLHFLLFYQGPILNLQTSPTFLEGGNVTVKAGRIRRGRSLAQSLAQGRLSQHPPLSPSRASGSFLYSILLDIFNKQSTKVLDLPNPMAWILAVTRRR